MKAPESRSRSDTRRYLIHLSCAPGENPGERRYVLRIQPWTPRSRGRGHVRERLFEDEYELVQAVNPLLPCGADVRHVLSYVESAEGFLYLLHLNSEQARTLGWQG
jgi:hypothetical protein